jgi:hypothetical protein
MSVDMSPDARARDCPECGCAGSLRLDVCQVCYAEVGERDRTLFWDLRFDEYLFETGPLQRP